MAEAQRAKPPAAAPAAAPAKPTAAAAPAAKPASGLPAVPADVAALLAGLKLTEFGPALVKDGVKTVASILKLTEGDLAEIGMPKVARRELLEAAAATQAR